MGAIGFYIGLPFIYLISIIPFPLFYGVSDFFFVLLYYVIGYRKKVVYQNLKNSFPEKTHEELKTIERKFYRYLCDLFLETFKTLTISKKEAINRCAFTQQTTDLFNKLNDEKKSCIIVMGHYGNWEWAGNTFSLLLKQQLYVIYHPLTNKQFNNLMYKMRTRFGNKLYAMREVMREMIKNRNEINATAFIADQTPPPEGAYWTTFLNQDTPVFVGTEKIAQKLNYPIVYVTVSRPKRGHYLVNAEILVNEPKSTKEGEISELHTRRLEEDIKKQPEIWLWSHRRWKHKRPAA
ncbi:MAG TPA: lysophospholipid acyltransferase family protein [Bacteroidia bacterium]|nr:lysophospholipid acyltransferase family protein [Bacteroidia bacterium]HRD37490.1 lysophospholipid acyltransferase family protein [Bacteroidia bacterium]